MSIDLILAILGLGLTTAFDHLMEFAVPKEDCSFCKNALVGCYCDGTTNDYKIICNRNAHDFRSLSVCSASSIKLTWDRPNQSPDLNLFPSLPNLRYLHFVGLPALSIDMSKIEYLEQLYIENPGSDSLPSLHYPKAVHELNITADSPIQIPDNAFVHLKNCTKITFEGSGIHEFPLKALNCWRGTHKARKQKASCLLKNTSIAKLPRLSNQYDVKSDVPIESPIWWKRLTSLFNPRNDISTVAESSQNGGRQIQEMVTADESPSHLHGDDIPLSYGSGENATQPEPALNDTISVDISKQIVYSSYGDVLAPCSGAVDDCKVEIVEDHPPGNSMTESPNDTINVDISKQIVHSSYGDVLAPCSRAVDDCKVEIVEDHQPGNSMIESCGQMDDPTPNPEVSLQMSLDCQKLSGRSSITQHEEDPNCFQVECQSESEAVISQAVSETRQCYMDDCLSPSTDSKCQNTPDHVQNFGNEIPQISSSEDAQYSGCSSCPDEFLCSDEPNVRMDDESERSARELGSLSELDFALNHVNQIGPEQSTPVTTSTTTTIIIMIIFAACMLIFALVIACIRHRPRKSRNRTSKLDEEWLRTQAEPGNWS